MLIAGQPFLGKAGGEMMRRRNQWSYVEVVFITVILGLIAIEAAPRFTQAKPENEVGLAQENTKKIRSQLDLYRAQHEGRLPPADSFRSFRAAMITKTGQFGPYVRKIPVNPFNDLNTVRFDGEPAGIGMAGWRFDTKTGMFQADDSFEHAQL